MDGEKEKSALDLLKEKASKGVVKCRICKEDHWTTNCPYKVGRQTRHGGSIQPYPARDFYEVCRITEMDGDLIFLRGFDYFFRISCH